MNKTVRISPSILAADFSRLGEQVREVLDAGADCVHVDVMDGHFVPNISIGPLVVRALRRITDVPLFVHLMIENADAYIDEFTQAGASSLTVHIEACPHLHRTIQHIKDNGLLAGVALNPATPAVLLSEILEYLDVALVMTVNPGFGGQSFIESMLPKIAQVSEMIRLHKADCVLEVDGGINSETAPRVVAEGANVLIAGSAIFGYREGLAAGLRRIQDSLVGLTESASC